MVIITRMTIHKEGERTCYVIPYYTIPSVSSHLNPQVPGHGKFQWTPPGPAEEDL